MDFKDMLKRRREGLEIGVRELARKADCSGTMIVQMEAGDSVPGYELTQRLALSLDISEDMLLLAAGHISKDARPRTVGECELIRTYRASKEIHGA